MSKPKYLTLRAIPKPSDVSYESYGSDEGPYLDVCYKDKSGHVTYPTRVFIPEKRFDAVGYSFDGRYESSEITDSMLIGMATEFITECEPWGYDNISDWKIDTGSFNADWLLME